MRKPWPTASRSWLIQRRSPPSAVAGDRNVPRMGTPRFVRLPAIEASSPRRRSFPIRRTMAPRSVTRTGSWTKIASARSSCGSSWYQTSAPEDRNISTSAACSDLAAIKSGRPAYPQSFGSAWAKASSGRRTRTVRRGSTMLWLPYDAPTFTSSREALAALSSSPKSSSIFGAARSGQDSSSAQDVNAGHGPLDRFADHAQRWKEDPRPRPVRVAGGRRQGDAQGRRLRPRMRLPADRHREDVRKRTRRGSGRPRERHSSRRGLHHDETLEQRPWFRRRVARLRREPPGTRTRVRRPLPNPWPGPPIPSRAMKAAPKLEEESLSRSNGLRH